MFKKGIAAGAAACLLLGLCSTSWAAGYPDVKSGDWYREAVLEMSEKGVIAGYPDGSFRPDRTVTCGEFIKMAVEVAGGAGTETAAVYSEKSGSETVDAAGVEEKEKQREHWALPWYTAGLCRGWYTKEEMRASRLDRGIRRDQMALVVTGVLSELWEEASGESEGAPDWMKTYSEKLEEIEDVDAKTDYEFEIVCAYSFGILTGYPDGSFRPAGTLNRAEAATVINRLYKQAEKTTTGKADEEKRLLDLAAERKEASNGTGNAASGEGAATQNALPEGELIAALRAGWTDEVWDSWDGEGEDEGNDFVSFRAGDTYQTNQPGLPEGALTISYAYPYSYNDRFSVNFGRGLLDKPDTGKEKKRISAVLKRVDPEGAETIQERFLNYAGLAYQGTESKSETFHTGRYTVTTDIREGVVTIYLWRK